MDPVALLASIDRNDEFATVLDAEGMRETESLFREFVREFQFPEYFGWNWPAFHECMRDLTWLPATGYRIVIRNGPALLADDPSETATFLRQMSDIGRTWGNSFALGEEWGGGEVPFNTVILGDPDRPIVQ
jgi:hypothetical protein